MSVQIRVYDDKDDDGQPVVVMVTRGTFDVSRLVDLMARGRSEDSQRAGTLARALRRRNGGKAALKLLRDHGGNDLLEEVPAEPDGLLGLVHRALADPGQFAPRNRTVATNGPGDWDYEPVPHWSARAAVAALAAHFTILPDQVNRFGLYVTEDGEVGINCHEGYTSTACLWHHVVDPERCPVTAIDWGRGASPLGAELTAADALEDLAAAQQPGDEMPEAVRRLASPGLTEAELQRGWLNFTDLRSWREEITASPGATVTATDAACRAADECKSLIIYGWSR